VTFSSLLKVARRQKQRGISTAGQRKDKRDIRGAKKGHKEVPTTLQKGVNRSTIDTKKSLRRTKGLSRSEIEEEVFGGIS